jgi:predicted kinase
MAGLHLMVGLPCSGKTMLAQKLAYELPALRLTLDEWHIRLFGQDAEEPDKPWITFFQKPTPDELERREKRKMSTLPNTGSPDARSACAGEPIR